MIDQSKVDALIQQMINIIDPVGAGPAIAWERLRDTVQRWAEQLNVEALAKLQHQMDALTERLEELHHAYDTLEAEHDKCRAASEPGAGQ
jgi:hypothetical protein